MVADRKQVVVGERKHLVAHMPVDGMAVRRWERVAKPVAVVCVSSGTHEKRTQITRVDKKEIDTARLGP